MLHLIARGAPSAEIAQLLPLSPKTVADHVSNVLHKHQVADRKEAALRAREAGLGQDKAPDKDWRGSGFGGRRYLPLLSVNQLG